MSFERILDQDVAVGLLRNMLRLNRLPHALLFTGPDGVGKTLTALETAKAINCEAPGANGCCDACHACRLVERGRHADVLSVHPTSTSNQITLKDRRDNPTLFVNYCELASYRPTVGKARVILVHQAHRLTDQAQTFFLKTLEEPSSHTVFILLSDRPGELMGTIRSRCQPVRFGALRPETVASLVRRETDVDETRARAVAVVAQGQVSRALNLATSEKRQVVLDLARRLSQGEDPLLLSQAFAEHLKEMGDTLKSRVMEQMGSGEEQADLSPEDAARLEEECKARINGLVRAESADYMYLLQTVYRDRMMWAATGSTDRLYNLDCVEDMKLPCPPGALAAIEKAWRYIERNLRMDRVFRDLFFTLAA